VTAVFLKPDDLTTRSAVEFLGGVASERTYKLPNPFYFVP